MEHLDHSDLGINQETIGFSDDFSSGLIDRAINPEKAREIDKKYTDRREIIDSQCATAKNNITCETQEKTAELASELPEQSAESLSSIGEYFRVDFSELHAELTSDGLNFETVQYFAEYKDYIENDLSDIKPEIKEKLIVSMQARIGALLKEVKKIKQEARKEIEKQGGNANDLSGQRWIINGKIDIFKEMTNKILPSALLKQAYDKAPDKGDFIEKLVGLVEYKEYTTGGNWEGESQLLGSSPKKTVTVEDQKASERHRIQGQIDTINAMFSAPVDRKNGEFDQWGPNTTLQTHTLHINIPSHARRFEAIGGDISKLSQVTLLNEADQQKEANIMIASLLLIGPMLIPGVGAVVSLPADITSLLTNQDPILKALKKMNPDFAEYHAEELPVEWLLGLLGIVSVAGGAQGATKIGKLAKISNGLSRIPSHMLTKSFADMGEKMGISPDMITKVKEMFLSKSSEAALGLKASMKPDELKAYNAEISAAYAIVDGKRVSTGVAPKDVQDANALLSPPARRAKTDALLGEKLSDELHQTILDVHNMKVEDIINSGNEGKTAEELTQILNIRKGIKLRKAGLEENQVRILMDQKIAGLPDELDSKTMSVLEDLTYDSDFGLKLIKKYPNLVKLLSSFGEQGGDISKTLDDINLDDDTVNNFGSISSELIISLTESEISKISDFLSSHGKTFPEGIDADDLKEYGDASLSGDILISLVNVLRDIKLGKSDEVVDTVVSKGDEVVKVVTDTKKLEGFDLMEVNHPDIFAIYQAIEASESFGGLLTKIDFKSEGVYDALDYLIDNTHSLINPQQLASIGRFLKKDVEDVSFNLEFTDGTAGITREFLRGIFRTQEEIKTGVKISDNPFDMRIQDLARLVKSKFGEAGTDISEYIKLNPNIQKAVGALKNADYNDLKFLKEDLSELGAFHETFGEENLLKLINDIFDSEDISIDKMLMNISKYDEAIENAAKRKLKNLNSILTSIGMPKAGITDSMREAIYLLEKLDKGSSSDIAYSIGRNHTISNLATSLGNDKFLELLNRLGINIPVGEQDDFFRVIESLSV